MTCEACGTKSSDGQKFCGQCGAALSATPVAVPGDEGAFFCSKHQKVTTRLRCGRCETPICTKCTVFSPAGTRCRACAKHKVAVRPAALLHEAGRVVASGTSGMGNRVWYMALWYFLLSLLRGGR